MAVRPVGSPVTKKSALKQYVTAVCALEQNIVQQLLCIIKRVLKSCVCMHVHCSFVCLCELILIHRFKYACVCLCMSASSLFCVTGDELHLFSFSTNAAPCEEIQS